MRNESEESLVVSNLELAVEGRVLLELKELRLAAGEVVVLHGPSGCGKSTLLRALAGLDDPARGSVHLRGKPAADWGWPAYRRRIPLVFQVPVLMDGTVGENLRRPFSYRSSVGASAGASGGAAARAAGETTGEAKYDRAVAVDLLKRVGLSARTIGQSARSLSVGEQQRVCLVRALLLEPIVLLLDEPMSGLDDAAAELVQHVLAERAQVQRISILAVSHHRQRFQGWCNREVELIPAEAKP